MNAPAEPVRPAWFRIGMADLLFVYLAILILHASKGGTLDDPGLGWHIRNIDAMIDQGGWLTQDPFSGPRGGQPWYTNQWIGDLALWLGDRWAGLNGIAVVSTLVLAFTYRCLYGMLRTDGLSWPAAAFWTYLACLGSFIAWQARPNLFTLLFLLLTARLLERFHQGDASSRSLLWLGPLFALWANTHGGFLAGVSALGIALFVEGALAVAAPKSDQRQAARQRLRGLIPAVGLALACTLLNPYGWKLYPWTLQLVTDSFFTHLHTEWKPIDFSDDGMFYRTLEALIVLFVVGGLSLAVAAFRGRMWTRINLVGLALSLFFLYQSLKARRFAPLWVIVAVPIMARAVADLPWLKAFRERLLPSAEMKVLLWPTRPGWLGATVAAVLFLSWARWGAGDFAYHSQTTYPTKALSRLLERHRELSTDRKQPVTTFHHYNWGGYLTWHGWPEFRNWIDDRNEVQGREHVEKYLAIINAEPGWEDQLGDVSLVCLPKPLPPLGQKLNARPETWKRVYEDDGAVIFERVGR